MHWYCLLWIFVRAFFTRRVNLTMENLALRQQLVIINRRAARPRLRNRDRLFWVAISKLWPNWRTALLIVRPETVVKWHKQGFRNFWRWKSRHKGGRPRIDQEVRNLIRRLSKENRNWGVPLIRSELCPSRLRCRRINSRQVHDPPSQATIANLASITGQPCQPDCRLRLFHRADCYLPSALCIRSSTPQRSEDPAHQRYHQAHICLDSPTNPPSFPMTQRQNTFSGITTAFTDRSSKDRWPPWASRKFGRRIDPPGKMPMSSV